LFEGRPEQGLLSSDALRPYTLVRLANRDNLVAEITARRPRIVLFPPFDGRGLPSSPLIERLRREVPDVIVGLVRTDQASLGLEVVRALRAGALVVHASEPAELRQALEQYLDGPPLFQSELSRLEHVLTDHLTNLPPLAHAMLRAAIRMGGRRDAVNRLASQFAISRRTLCRRARGSGLPAPKELVTWARLLQAGVIAERGSAKQTAIVRAAGFCSTAVYHAALRKLLAHIAGGRSDPDAYHAITGPQEVAHAIAANCLNRLAPRSSRKVSIGFGTARSTPNSRQRCDV
jgi:AraC-like DNA-binding protein